MIRAKIARLVFLVLSTAVYPRPTLFGVAALVCALAAGGPPSQAAPFEVTTYHYDGWRTGWNSQESELTPNGIANGQFGLLRTINVDQQVDAQPLVISDVGADGKAIDRVYVVTENDTVYAIDADSGNVLKTRTLGMAVPAGDGKVIECGNNSDFIGITGTPVIDRKRNMLFVIAFMMGDSGPEYKLFALDLYSLQDNVPPRTIQASATATDGSVLYFKALYSRQRAALALANNTIYAAFGSFCDHNAGDTRGWLLGWQEDTLEPLAEGQVTDHRNGTQANYYLSSIWMSGYGPAVNETGDLYLVTGNSKADSDGAKSIVDPTINLPESVVRIGGDLKLPAKDFFTPSNVDFLNNTDNDLGSGGVLLIPDEFSGGAKHLAVTAGKDGRMFLLDRDNLGHFHSDHDQVLGVVRIGKCWCGETYFRGVDGAARVVSSGGDTLSVWKLAGNPGAPILKDWDATDKLGVSVFQKGFFTTVSSNGTAQDSGIVWAVQRPDGQPPKLTLWAFNGSTGVTVAKVDAGDWPHTGGAANAIPVVANGRVYVASYGQLRIFGKTPTVAALAPRALARLQEAAIGQSVSVSGTVVEVDGSTLYLRTRTRMVGIDVGAAEKNQKALTLVPGQAVFVAGHQQAEGVVAADSIEHANDSPSLWKPDVLPATAR